MLKHVGSDVWNAPINLALCPAFVRPTRELTYISWYQKLPYYGQVDNAWIQAFFLQTDLVTPVHTW